MLRRLPWLALLLLLCASSAQSDPPAVPVRAGDILSTTGHTATSDLHALIRVDPMTGNRSIVSDDSTGTGPVFGPPHPDLNPVQPQLNFAYGVVVDARGDILVADAGRWLVWRIDALSGDREILSGCVDFIATLDCPASVGLGPSIPDPRGIALENDGQILVIDGSLHAVVRIDPTTGDRTIVSGCPFPNCDWSTEAIGTGNNFRIPKRVAVEADGNILVGDPSAGPPGNQIARVDPVTGDRTPVLCARCPDGGSGPWPLSPYGIAVEEDGNILGSDQSTSTALGVFRIDPITLVRTIVSNADEGTGVPFIYPGQITIEETGAILVADSGRLIRVDPVSGDRELVTGDGVGFGPVFSSFGLAIYPERCGDVNDDGLLDATDVNMLRANIADPTGAPLPPGGEDKCTVIGVPGPCDLLDQVVISRRLAMLEPGIEPVCVAIAGS